MNRFETLWVEIEREFNVSAMSSGGFGTTHYQNTTNDNRKHK